MTSTAARSTLVTEADDHLHTPTSEDILWNESAWFSFSIPERDLEGIVWINHRANMQASKTGVILYDPSGEETYDCVHFDWGEYYKLTPDTDMFDFTTPNSLSVKIVEPLNRYSINYDRDGVELDLDWQGIAPVITRPFDPGSDGWGPDHYEQPGRVTGTLRLHGTEFQIDSHSNRDRSWGVRDYQRRSWSEFPRHDYPWFCDGEGTAMTMYTLPTEGWETDPVIGAKDKMLWGWYHKDGVTSNLVKGSRDAVERRPDGVPWVIRIDGEDELGRTFEAEGRMKAVLKGCGLPALTVFWGPCEWTFDDGTKMRGETGECFPGGLGRRFLRSLPVKNRLTPRA